MTITAQQAAAVAKEHGLGLSDASTLRGLAESVEEAKAIAATFAPEDKRQWSQEDMDNASPSEILAARDRGQLRDLLTEPEPDSRAKRELAVALAVCCDKSIALLAQDPVEQDDSAVGEWLRQMKVSKSK